MHSTNYFNTFIEVAEDCPTDNAEIPPIKEGKLSIANMQFDMLYDNPYKYTSDDVLFTVFAERKKIPSEELDQARISFFSKGQPCFRSSPLTKRYGWGLHSNESGLIALYPMESPEYQDFVDDGSITKTKAMRSKRK